MSISSITGFPRTNAAIENVNYSPILTMPVELLKRFIHYLNVKDLGRLAQVSRIFLEYASVNEVWRDLCVENPDVDLGELSLYSGNYKALYIDSDLKQFQKCENKYFSLYNGIKVPVYLNIGHPYLMGKHLYRIAIKQIRQVPGMSSCKLEDFEITLFGIIIKHEDSIYKWINGLDKELAYSQNLGYIIFKSNTLCKLMYCHQVRGNDYNDTSILLDYVEEAYKLAQSHDIFFHNASFKTLLKVINPEKRRDLVIIPINEMEAWKYIKPLLKESSLKIHGKISAQVKRIYISACIEGAVEKEQWDDLCLKIKRL